MEQSPRQPPPRSVQTVRGMLISLVPLVLLVLLVGGLTGQCSFSPGGPDTSDAVTPTVDAPAELTRLARAAPFPVRVPAVPGDWRATSVDAERMAEGPDAPLAVQVGWLTPGTEYLRLSQSSAGEPELVRFEVSSSEAPGGTVTVAGTPWRTYPGIRGEQVWVADLGDARVLITGSAAEAAFRTLAEATLDAPVAPVAPR